MAFEGIIRASFQTNVKANQAVSRALVGHAQDAAGPGPFRRVGTHAFSCTAAADADVAAAIEELGEAVREFGGDLDFLSISVVRSN